MPSGLPSRRTLLASFAALAAWLLGRGPARAAQPGSAAPPSDPPALPAPPRVVRIAEPPPGSGKVVVVPPTGAGEPRFFPPGRVVAVVFDPKGACETREFLWKVVDTNTLATTVHASCRVESVSGERLGREEYEVVVEDGGRFVRVTTFDRAGAFVKTERLPF